MQPLIDSFFREYLEASEIEDKEAEREAIHRLSSGVSSLSQESLADYLSLQGESNRLKLTATKDMLASFEELERAMNRSFEGCNSFMGDFVNLVVSNDQQVIGHRQAELEKDGVLVQQKSKALFEQMRAELSVI